MIFHLFQPAFLGAAEVGVLTDVTYMVHILKDLHKNKENKEVSYSALVHKLKHNQGMLILAMYSGHYVIEGTAFLLLHFSWKEYYL